MFLFFVKWQQDPKPPNKNSDAKKFPLLLMRQAQLEAMELEKQREKEARYSSKRQNDLTNGTIWRGITYPTCLQPLILSC